ncbi:phosphatidylinositol-4- kinase [Recurvomyces mirabilis]|nr:phosphatidylinositol-4- kinase [Recurvomyces mirabilis]
MGFTRRATRRDALVKLATLSAQTAGSGHADRGGDIEKLCQLHRPSESRTTNGTNGGDAKGQGAAAIPMSIRELEVLIALCKAAPAVRVTSDAAHLLNQLSPYLSEAHKQTLKPSPLHQHLPPWETLSHDLASAVLSIGLHHASLRQQALACVDTTIEELTTSTGKAIWMKPRADGVTGPDVAQQCLPAVQLGASLLGFMEAIAQHVQVWTQEQRIALLQRLRYLLSEKFMVSFEGALSAVRNASIGSRAVKEWRRWVRHYAAQARPLGAMLLQQAFMKIVEQSSVLIVSHLQPIPGKTMLDELMMRDPLVDRSGSRPSSEVLESLAELIVEEMSLLEADADYLQVSSSWQQRLTLDVKAMSLRSFLCCTLVDETIADDDLILAWLEGVTADQVQMSDDALAQTVLKCMALLARLSPAMASNLTRSLPRLIVQGKMTASTASLAGNCLGRILESQPQDIVISTLYSLGNVLSTNAGSEASGTGLFATGADSLDGTTTPYGSQNVLGSSISLVTSDEEESAVVSGSIVEAIVSVAVARNDAQLTALVISMLVQKIGRINQGVDARIIKDIAPLGLAGGSTGLRALLRLYNRVASDATVKHNELFISAVTAARIRLASWIRKDSPLYEVYLVHLLGLCVGSGDTAGERTVDIVLTSQTIAQLFRPMAVLVSSDLDHTPAFENVEDVKALSRNSWFNLVVHGFTLTSASVKENAGDLQILAQYTLPLVDEDRIELPESGIDLNTVLRRGSHSQRSVEQKTALNAALPHCEADIRGLSYQECVFLNAALLVSTMRARAGDCTAVLPYFTENKVKTSAMGSCMLAIGLGSVETYLERALNGKQQKFAAPQVALQLATIFEGCCHRVSKVQHAAVSFADRIITAIPSALCQRASLFALLELLTLMWKSCLDAETDEYDWKSTYSSTKANVILQLSDDINYRQNTLTNFHTRAKLWVAKAIDAAPLDVKGLLQAYLEDYEDDGAYGHIALGRSFAVDLGSIIPSTDQRLISLDRQREVGVNTASDFMAQYTTRQQYRQSGDVPSTDGDWAFADYDGSTHVFAVTDGHDACPEAAALRQLADRLRRHEVVPFAALRETLRDAAAVLSGSVDDRSDLIHDLVEIPFAVFTKQSINLGVSLWLGLIKENPALETRILAEIAAGWESTVRLRKGFFYDAFHHQDPFYVKEEFAPSQWPAISKRQQLAHNLIAPHLRLTQWLSSHFNATRLTSPFVGRVYIRLMRTTMFAMKHAVTQPLAREVHFHIVLLALTVVRYSTRIETSAQRRLKDAILSAGLAWFAAAPRWSFGSNQLQVKAEIRLLGDVATMLQATTPSSRSTSTSRMASRQDLLLQLIQQEVSRLVVWNTPLAADGSSMSRESSLTILVATAWQEDPRIAVNLTTRFPHSDRMQQAVRSLLVREPEKAIGEADALNILLGQSLPSDIHSQLKYLLYWAPINPMAAVTYFMPAYRNHPLIVQYAMRALEAHAVDITFFYVPQIVQTLRYDALGYVERYIVETAKFSQLFAHQIIWNIKANSYKDEDSQEPDSAKPIFDKVTNALIASFSTEDKSFYEREFDFFGKVTGISGTLKPFIKAPKPEKKAKIEEELRKIQLDVGVYLPSNPDGVLIGIDRKSGKPLQSHAKAPFMATFRIRKDEGEVEPGENQVASHGQEVAKRQTYEVWQSAIFKVGDDCRQDVLALQLIACFRGIFNSVGLDVYVFPYRVTATAPGCGVIDVLPNSISRDMLGREAVNGLYEYFVSKYGSEDSIRFQEARSNFIKSMAAYSIISYLLQFKDRHNGNIMVDDAGHILHIDFGFCFDIVPGGVKFERAPFKLSPEMVAVMGGSTQSQPFKAFEELCVKAFLASRQYVEQLAHVIQTMLDSGLPCFKPTTIQHFKERFVLDRSDREAAQFVRKLVHWSERSYSTGVYDYYQLLTNGIPY